MAVSKTPPIDIASSSSRFGSSSPRNPTSNLTSALQGAGATSGGGGIANGTTTASRSSAININGHALNDDGLKSSNLRDGSSFANGNGAVPMSFGDRMRRESLAGSLVNGASWGGMSVGSLLRDDIMMQGTSPYNFQSPSFHSSSYLPKMEANFMRDFICCGITFEDMHDLVNHYEQVHRDGVNDNFSHRPTHVAPSMGPMLAQASRPSIGAGMASGPLLGGMPAATLPNMQSKPGHDRQPVQVEDVDTLDDMELDEPTTPAPINHPNPMAQFQNQVRTNSAVRVPTLNTAVANTIQQHHGLRSSTPTTPVPGVNGFQYQYNPTVSSVNTPTLNTPSITQAQAAAAAGSGPTTPAATTHTEAYGNFTFGNNAVTANPTAVDGMGTDWNIGGDDVGGFIDQPAKRLSSKGLSSQAQLNIEMLKRLREQQIAGGGVAGVSLAGMPGEEMKPFKCPVIGCEKAYKNQNGLKYHKQHGHQKQQLKENADGTFSIVDPVTSIPYPGTEGMEKEKPYRCDVCGKRYKNLNGLKYHRQHSPMCNPELAQIDPLGGPAGGAGVGLDGMNTSVGGGMNSMSGLTNSMAEQSIF